MRHLTAGLLAISAAACGKAIDTPPSAADSGTKARDVYVARSAQPHLGPDGKPAPSRLALFDGAYRVVNNCLVFDQGENNLALVRFGQMTEIGAFNDHVVIGGQKVMFGEKTKLGGGLDGDRAYDLLAEPPPANCRFPVIGP